MPPTPADVGDSEAGLGATDVDTVENTGDNAVVETKILIPPTILNNITIPLVEDIKFILCIKLYNNT